MQLISIQNPSAFFGFGIELDGKSYRLSFRFNERIGLWIMGIEDGEGRSLLEGLRAVVDFPMTARFGGRYDLPPGEFFFVDTTSQKIDPGFADLGSRVQLWYVTAAELAA